MSIEKILEKGQELDFNKLLENEKKEIKINIEEKIPEDTVLQEKYEDKDPDEYGQMTDLMNIHQIYYRTLFKKKNNENMFEEINYEDKTSTNRSMELFYEYFYEYKQLLDKNEDFVAVYTIDSIEEDKCEEIYGILLDNDIKYLSPSIYSLYLLLAENKLIKWQSNNWKIIQVKSKES